MLIMQTDFTMAVNILGGNHFIKNVFSYDVLKQCSMIFTIVICVGRINPLGNRLII